MSGPMVPNAPAVPKAGGGGRPRSPTRLITVQKVAHVTPGLTRVTFGGPALAGFGPPKPAAHIKLLFPSAGWVPEDEAAPRPPRRTYTPRSFDPVANTLDVEFVHHGDGLAATWAAGAEPGQSLYLNGPGGGYDVSAAATDLVLVADDTALPAAGMIVEAMPAGCRAVALCEVADARERRPLSTRADASSVCSPVWLFRSASGSQPGALLEDAVRELAGGQAPGRAKDTWWWIACEAAAMRRIRRHLLVDRGIDPARVHTRGYWKLGETAYPDHDYGRD